MGWQTGERSHVRKLDRVLLMTLLPLWVLWLAVYLYAGLGAEVVLGDYWWVNVPASIGFAVVASIILVRAPAWHLSTPSFVIGIAAAFLLTRTSYGSLIGWLHSTEFLIEAVVAPVASILVVSAAFNFPDRSTSRSSLEQSTSWGFGLAVSILYLFLLDSEFHLLPRWASGLAPRWTILEDTWSALFVCVIIVVLAILTHNYLRADPVGRRQVKWILYGAYVSGIAFAVQQLGWLWVPGALVELFMLCTAAGLAAGPICVLIAVFGYRFLDVDPLLSSTVSYSILLVPAVAAVLVLVPGAAEVASARAGFDPATTRLILSLAIAAIAVPAHRSLRPRIDLLLFSERGALAEGVEGLLQQLSSCSEPRQLITRAAEKLNALLLPESCVMYAEADQGFVPIFVSGRAAPPFVEGDSPLISTLKHRSAPLASDRFPRRDRIEQLSSYDRATLETLGATVVLPVRRREDLIGFLCLGPRRSRDIYTRTDLALLAAVANLVSTELERFNQEEIAEAAREMTGQLRRYVPKAITRQLEAGGNLDAAEQSVSVLFVDIRGYTSYSETHDASDVFTTVNRYTTSVSAIVERFGGSVVEFNGDGLMAVFGAPIALAEKERSAIAAGRSILMAMDAMRGTDPVPADLSVGVGIATGAAFVGNIQSADRLIWTALGTTTNLAARLQDLTRDLDVDIVVDRSTRTAAGDAARDFERRDAVRIRGRQYPEDVYVLSPASAGLDSGANDETTRWADR